MKARVSTDWLSGCSGCHVAMVDLHEKLIGLVDEVDFVRVPVLMDEKNYPKADVGIVEGAVRSEHDRVALEKMRASVDKLIAFGSCAVYGGPSGLGWLHEREDVMAAIYDGGPTNAGGERPDSDAPVLEDSVVPIDEVVEVDAYLPGCPPHPYFIAAGLRAVLGVSDLKLTSMSVCADCDRKMHKNQGARVAPGRSHRGEGQSVLSEPGCRLPRFGHPQPVSGAVSAVGCRLLRMRGTIGGPHHRAAPRSPQSHRTAAQHAHRDLRETKSPGTFRKTPRRSTPTRWLRR